jgi:hypothetical protein
MPHRCVFTQGCTTCKFDNRRIDWAGGRPSMAEAAAGTHRLAPMGGSAPASFSAPATPLASARRPEDASAAAPPRRLTAAERALERAMAAKRQEVKRKGQHLTINLKNANNAAAIVREVAVGEMKWKEASTLEASCNANLYWYERAISVDEVKRLSDWQRVNMIPGMQEMAKKVPSRSS